jgi:hypothetical protein
MSEERDIVANIRWIKLSGTLAPYAVEQIEEAASEIQRLRGEVERLRFMVRRVAWRDHDGAVFNAFREDIDLRTQAPGIEDLFPEYLQGE